MDFSGQERNEVNRLLSALAVLMTGAPLVPLQSQAATGAELQDIRSSVTCLAHDRMQMLGRPVPSEISLIYSKDEQSYQGERHLWLFLLRGRGVYDVFDVEVIRQPHRVYSLVNNATIRWDGRTIRELGALLGGIWTHNVMERNFRAAMKANPTRLRPSAPVRQRLECESYAQPDSFHQK
jgi:hypothetical protein